MEAKTTDGRDKTVRNLKTGELFIETAQHMFTYRIERWDFGVNHCIPSIPCPMIQGHQMFRHPEYYNCERVNY